MTPQELLPNAWQALGLPYPTTPLGLPEFRSWTRLLSTPGLLQEDEVLLEMGLAGDVLGAALAGPRSPHIEGMYALTNYRAFYGLEADLPTESGLPPESPLRVFDHAAVTRLLVERAWGDPSSGEIRTESDAPSEQAILWVERESGFPEAAILHMDVLGMGLHERAGVQLSRSGKAQFFLGRKGAANWEAVVERFRNSAVLPDGVVAPE